MLLRLGTHRDLVLVARMVEYNLIEPERANWRAGHRAAVAYRKREDDLAVPYNHVEGGDGHGEGGFPLGRWLSDQCRAMLAGTMLPARAEDLETLDVVVFQERCAYAVRTGDVGLLAGVCAGKHGR
ncbi:helicase associated domain-containing protein [Streptomyces zhihengii]|uniref:helicase associated domain-containing protein n=1 Tax=Streptomyces zhihengii TaxID=1818004 RepID=UPI0033BAB15E